MFCNCMYWSKKLYGYYLFPIAFLLNAKSVVFISQTFTKHLHVLMLKNNIQAFSQIDIEDERTK